MSSTHHQQHRKHIEEFTSSTSKAYGTAGTKEGCKQFEVDTTTTQTKERRTNNLKLEMMYCLDSRKGSYYHNALNFLQSKVAYRLALPPTMPKNHNAFRADILIYNVLCANKKKEYIRNPNANKWR